MLLAAKLDALAAERARYLGPEPEVAQEARNRVLLRAERRYPPGMNDVSRGSDDADFLADRHDDLVIDFQEVVLALRRLVVDLLARRGEHGDEADPLPLALDVVVAPLPLVARHLDRDVRRGRVLLRDDHLRHRP